MCLCRPLSQGYLLEAAVVVLVLVMTHTLNRTQLMIIDYNPVTIDSFLLCLVHILIL